VSTPSIREIVAGNRAETVRSAVAGARKKSGPLGDEPSDVPGAGARASEVKATDGRVFVMKAEAKPEYTVREILESRPAFFASLPSGLAITSATPPPKHVTPSDAQIETRRLASNPDTGVTVANCIDAGRDAAAQPDAGG
jgi:hypothetical protein